MMKRILDGSHLFLFALMALLPFATGFAEDVAPIRAKTSPALDGKLSDDCWKQAEMKSGFVLFKRQGDRQEDTCFGLAYDHSWLYIGLQCENPLQKLIFTPKHTDHDGQVQKDESVEIFLDPGTDGKMYYQFKLSCFNIKAEQRLRSVPAFVRESDWDYPWRSATARTDTGWTAEIAIPLELMASYGDFGKIRLNVIRNRLAPVMDEHGVITHDERFSSSWQPVARSFHEPESFGRVVSFRPEKLEVPFLPSLVRSDIGACYLKDGKKFFNVSAMVRGATVRNGELELVVEDCPAVGEGVTVRNAFVLNGTEQKELTLPVPMASISDRTVTVFLRDAKTGEVWGKTVTENPSALTVLNTYLDRNYYTSEEEAVLVAEIGLPPESLSGLAMCAVGPGGKMLAKSEKVTAETHLAFPIAGLAIGTHTIRMELRQADAKPDVPAMLSEDLTLVKRAPKPGLAWKMDQINRVLLKPDGTPFFPIGIIMGDCDPEDEFAFRKLSDGGFNTFYQWYRYLEAAETVRYLKMAKKYGLYAVCQLETGWEPVRDADLKLPAKYLKDDDERNRLLKMFQTGSVHLRVFLMLRVTSSMPSYAERTEIFEEYYYKNVKYAEEVVRSVMDQDNLIGYDTFDEPTANNWFRISDSLAHLRQTTHQIDGYHPVVFVAPKEIPEDRVYESATDIFLPDPYWCPAAGESLGEFNTPNSVARRMNLSFERNRKSRKVLWALPVGWMWSGILKESKRPIAREEQHCQNFLAIIHGVRGLFWFRWPMPEIGWNNLVESVKMLNVIGPMAVQPKVSQQVAYEKITAEDKRETVRFDIKADTYPDVQGCVFRDPAGGFVLLAANSTYFPGQAEVLVDGLNADVKRLFADKTLTTEQGGFTEELEPLAVRAYHLGELPEPLSVRIAFKRTGPASPLAAGTVANRWRKDKKNMLLNPSFEETTIENVTDYHLCSANGAVLEQNPVIAKFGEKCMRCDMRIEWYTNSFLGKRTARIQTFPMLTINTSPQVKVDTPCVFSVWLRGKEGGEQAEIRAFGKREAVTLEKDWRRFSFAGVIPPKLDSRNCLTFYITMRQRDGIDSGTFRVDGVQLEKGDTATPFED